MADDTHLVEEPLHRRPVFEGRLLRVSDDTVRLPAGGEAHREVVRHPGAVAIVPVLGDGRTVLVRQWRHAVGRALWELPAGTRDPSEEPADTARRELAEETGYTAENWRPLGHGAVSPGYSSEEIHFFLATGLSPGDTSPDPDEVLDVGAFDDGELATMASGGECDLKTIAGLALARAAEGSGG